MLVYVLNLVPVDLIVGLIVERHSGEYLELRGKKIVYRFLFTFEKSMVYTAVHAAVWH